MRLASVATIMVGALAMSPTTAGAQQRSDVGGLSVGGMPHPVSAAIAYWDTLNLTESQIESLRQVEGRVSMAVFRQLEREVVDTSVRLRFWRPGPIDSVAVAREARAQLDGWIRVELAMLRARDETYAILSTEQRARLDSLVLGLLGNPATAPPRECSDGGVGGSTRLSDRAQLVYSLEYDGDSARIRGVVIAQADADLTSRPGPGRANDAGPARGGGGSAGRWSIRNDDEGDAVWIDSVRVDRKGHNIVFLQGVDRVTRMPDVAGFASVPPSFFTGACRDSDAGDALRTHVLRSPEVRAFLERPARPRSR